MHIAIVKVPVVAAATCAAAVFAVARQSNGDSPESPFYYADIIIIMAKGAKEEQKFAAPISSWWPNETMNKIVFLLDNALMSL